MYKELKTPCGVIKGIIEDDILKFKGIRYATAERWKYPTLVTKWDGVLEAYEYGPCCYQRRAFVDEEKENSFYFNEYRKGIDYSYSEDCLYLNVFSPKDVTPESKLPVIVYIHGGSFRSCSANERCFMDPVWPKKGVVAVTINYRLGILGFMCLDALTKESGNSGNYALADQITSLKWVRDNIASFGGDPDNVTIMGQSAGAMSVQALCLSKEAKGLFHKTVMVSGGGTHPLMTWVDNKKIYKKFNKIYEACGCKSIEEFRNIDVNVLFKKYYEICETDSSMGMVGKPYLDGKYLDKNQNKAIKEISNIPHLIGVTSDDIIPGILFNMSKRWCLIQNKKKHVPSYLWMFNRRLPGDNSGAFHCADMNYWFGTLNNSWRPFTKEDYELSDKMTSYLCNFARTGNPNSEDLVNWEPISRKQKNPLILNDKKIEMNKVDTFELFKKMFKRPVGF